MSQRQLLEFIPGISSARPWRFVLAGSGPTVYGPLEASATRALYSLEVYLRRADTRVPWESYLSAEEREQVERAVDATLAGASAQVSGYRG
jgi:hypothetical protein